MKFRLSRSDTGWPLSALMANAVEACIGRLCLITGEVQHAGAEPALTNHAGRV